MVRWKFSQPNLHFFLGLVWSCWYVCFWQNTQKEDVEKIAPDYYLVNKHGCWKISLCIMDTCPIQNGDFQYPSLFSRGRCPYWVLSSHEGRPWSPFTTPAISPWFFQRVRRNSWRRSPRFGNNPWRKHQYMKCPDVWTLETKSCWMSMETFPTWTTPQTQTGWTFLDWQLQRDVDPAALTRCSDVRQIDWRYGDGISWPTPLLCSSWDRLHCNVFSKSPLTSTQKQQQLSALWSCTQTGKKEDLWWVEHANDSSNSSILRTIRSKNCSFCVFWVLLATT